jgi:S1-C subfamily serine protease
VQLSGRNALGEHASATAFHIGDGIFVTARHVADELVDRRLSTSNGLVEPYHQVDFTDQDIDVALLLVDPTDLDPAQRDVYVAVPLALNELVDRSCMLERVLVMGYPRVPMSASAELVAATGEIIAIVDTIVPRNGPSIVISQLPRGGLSGSPVLDASGNLQGVVVDSLSDADLPYELGYTAAITVESILRLLVGINHMPRSLSGDDWSTFTNALFPLGVSSIEVPPPPTTE